MLTDASRMSAAGCTYYYKTLCNNNGNADSVQLYNKFRTQSGTFTFSGTNSLATAFVHHIENKVLVNSNGCATTIESETENDNSSGTWTVNEEGTKISIVIDGDLLPFDILEMSPNKLVIYTEGIDGDGSSPHLYV